jgi:hypothetical protein
MWHDIADSRTGINPPQLHQTIWRPDCENFRIRAEKDLVDFVIEIPRRKSRRLGAQVPKMNASAPRTKANRAG